MYGCRSSVGSKLAGFTITIVATLGLGVVQADAQTQSSAKQRCINTLNKGGGKVAAARGKLNAGCIKDKGSGKLVGTVDDCLTNDPKSKVSKAIEKNTSGEDKKCTTNPDFGATDAATGNAAALNREEQLTKDVFGDPVDVAIIDSSADKAGASCQSGVAKAYEKMASTRVKEFGKCKKGGLKLGSITSAASLAGCVDDDPKLKVVKAREKLQKTIDTKCDTTDLAAAFPGCAVATGAELLDCVTAHSECRMCLLLNDMDDIEALCDQLDDGVVNASCEQCNNGQLDPGEECDDGLGNSDVAPNACRTTCELPSCGDGVTDDLSGEQCDDAGVSAGCDADCTLAECGDGTINALAGEVCDDGLGNSDVTPDACRTNCQPADCGDDVIDTGEQCDDGGANSDVAPNACRTTCELPSCGDGVADDLSGEECDDSGVSAACDGDCTLATCGDGVINGLAGEVCDDGAGNSDVNPDACRTSCQPADCGDDVIDTGEQCDDGGANSDVNPNACRTTCELPSCGDGVTDDLSGEECDDSGVSAACDGDCTLAICGDGTINALAGEVCDDGGANSDVNPDACRTNCQPADCGDSVVDTGEECDDGNTTGGDGCSAVCTCGMGSGELACITPDPQCPNLGELVLYGGVSGECTNNGDCPVGECDTGIGRCTTVTDLDTGWTGIAHDADINDRVVTRGTLLCGDPPTCGECIVTGVDPSTRSCRCANNNRTICDEPFVADSDCGGAICNCYLGQPLPLSAGNTPACAVNRFGQNITGTANVDTGEGQLDVRLRSQVYLGPGLAIPCPVCGGTCTAPPSKVGDSCALDRNCDVAGVCDIDTCTAGNVGDPCTVDDDCDPVAGVCGNYDPTVNDGVRGGTCYIGKDDSMPCDVESVHTTFPANGGGGYSLDCFPTTGANVTGSGLRINLLQTTGMQSLTANVDCGFPPPPLPGFLTECHCSVCTGDTSIPCRNNADCGGSGNCALIGNGVPLPHQCDSLADTCMDLGGGEGECPNGPTDSFCDGFLRANGEGFISCTTNDDCDSLPEEFPNGTGQCTLTKERPCFRTTITAQGVADPNAPVGAAIFCIAQTSSAGINSVAGLPGPGRVINQATARTFCASDNNVEYMPGVGGCPPP